MLLFLLAVITYLDRVCISVAGPGGALSPLLVVPIQMRYG